MKKFQDYLSNPYSDKDKIDKFNLHHQEKEKERVAIRKIFNDKWNTIIRMNALRKSS